MTVTFTILSAPRTKKNSSRLVRTGRMGRHRIIPSKAHEEWHANACRQGWVIKEELRSAGHELPITQPVNVTAIFYRSQNSGDACGFYQALGDWLEDMLILKNDKQISSWNGSRLDKDVENPRIEVTITWE